MSLCIYMGCLLPRWTKLNPGWVLQMAGWTVSPVSRMQENMLVAITPRQQSHVQTEDTHWIKFIWFIFIIKAYKVYCLHEHPNRCLPSLPWQMSACRDCAASLGDLLQCEEVATRCKVDPHPWWEGKDDFVTHVHTPEYHLPLWHWCGCVLQLMPYCKHVLPSLSNF